MPFNVLRAVAKLATAAMLIAAVTACSSDRLKKLERIITYTSTEIAGEFCTLNLKTPAGLKFYFIIDVTGSNGNTDPGKVRRAEGMRLMAEKFPEAMFALQTFADGGANEYFPFIDGVGFQGVIDNFVNAIADAGGTPYGKPLQEAARNIGDYMLQQLALARPQRDPAGPIVVIFISDGVPTDGITVEAVATLVKDILKKPIALNALEVTNEVIVNSGVYGTQANNPLELQAIAENGYGTYMDFNTGMIDFSKFRIPSERTPTGESFGLFATNLNTLWGKSSNGSVKLEADADEDGLSDSKERELGSDSFNPDTDGNGVSDGVEAFYFGTPCTLDGCITPTRAQDVRKPTTCDFLPTTEGGGTGHYANDILNNCEKIIAQANYKLFSAIGDKIPDGVKVRNGISPKDTTLGQSDPENDGLTTLQKLMLNLPWWYPKAQAQGFKATQYITRFTGVKNNRNCYSFQIKDLPMIELPYGSKNHVRLWLTQSDRDLRDLLRVADIMIEPGAPASISDGNFRN